MPRTVRLFISSSPADAALVDRLRTHIALMAQQKLIEVWTERSVLPGETSQAVAEDQLESAEIVVLVVTPSYIAAHYKGEMARALELHERGELRVIPVLGRPLDMTDAPFAHLSPLPSNKVPVTEWRDADAAWTDVTMGLRKVVHLLQSSPPRVPKGQVTGANPPGSPGVAPRAQAGAGAQRKQILDELLALPAGVFEIVVVYSDANTALLPSSMASPALRAVELLKHCEARPGGLQALADAIRHARDQVRM